MKNLKMLYIALIALVAGAFGACTTAEFEPGPQVSGPQVSFLTNNPTSIEFTGAEGEEVQRLVLSRFETEKELEVFILADMPKEDMPLFNIPESVVFEAGQATAELVMTIDHAKFESDKTYTVGFYIDETATTPYGCAEWTVTFALNPWELMTDDKGNNVKGKFRGNDLFTSLFNIDPEVEIDVNVYEHKTRKGYYKVEDPWALSIALGFGYSSLEEGLADGLATTHADFLIDASNPNQVVFAQQTAGVDIGYGDLVIESGYPRYFDAAAGAGTLSEGIITFPTKGCIFAMPGYSSSAYYANNNGLFRLMLPGVDISDYSLTVAYDGMDVAADNKTTTAKFKFSYGDDVTGINYMIVAGNQESQAAALLATLVAGTDENILAVENFEKGGKQANVKVGLESGLYTIVAAPADKNGALRTAEAVVNSFYFVGMGEVIDMTCQLEGLMVLPSEYNPALTASYPDQTSLFLMLAGKDIKSAKYYLNTTAAIATWTDTPEALVAAYGSEFPASHVDKINSENGVVVPFKNLAEDTEYAAIVVATNIYGESKTLILTKKTAANDYNGELKIGNYSMYCKYVYGNEAAGEFMESSNVFNLKSNGGSHTDFLVTNIGIENGAVWHAKYDSAAGTLTLDGTELGYEEEYGNQFGGLYGYYDSAKTMGYGLFSYASAESNGNDPLVLTVDPSTKQLSGLATLEFAVQVHQLVEGYPFLGYVAYFVNSLTEVALNDATASKQSVKNESVVPFRNAKGVRGLTAPKDKYAVSFKAGEALNVASKGVKSVKPSVVENYTPVKSKGFKVVEISGAKIAR